MTKQNVYLHQLEKDGWNDVQAYHIENESAWRSVAIIAICALVIVSIFAIYMVNQDKHKVLVFEKDSLGNITTLGLASKTINVDNKIIAHQLANFTIALREVPKDAVLKRRNIDIVHKMTDPAIKAQIDQMFITQYSKYIDTVIAVNLNQIKPLESGKSWEISWSEQEVLADGSTGKTTNFSSVISFIRKDSLDTKTQLVNPIGLLITYIHPVEDINAK
jgi:type IV secretory pathway TrbF-like protein